MVRRNGLRETAINGLVRFRDGFSQFAINAKANFSHWIYVFDCLDFMYGHVSIVQQVDYVF